MELKREPKYKYLSEIQKYLGDKILRSSCQIQEIGTNYCGHLCLKVLYELNKGESFENIILELIETIVI